MIRLSRLNGTGFWLSSDQIEFMESTPDTVLSLLSGKKVIVKEKPDEIVGLIVAFRRKVALGPEILVDKQGKETSGGS